jgi:hypothetical protein
MWETTVALNGVPTTLSSIIKSEPMLSSTHGEIFTTSSSGSTPLNGLYTETFTIPPGLTQETLNGSIISINGAQIINGADLDLSKLQV